MKGANTAPWILVINEGVDLIPSLRKALAAAFGDGAQPSAYSRPAVPDHPRMKPGKRPLFDLVIVDVQSWVKDLGSATLLGQTVIPKWLTDDIFNRLKNAYVLFLVPDDALQGTKQHLLGIEDRSVFITREFLFYPED